MLQGRQTPGMMSADGPMDISWHICTPGNSCLPMLPCPLPPAPLRSRPRLFPNVPLCLEQSTLGASRRLRRAPERVATMAEAFQQLEEADAIRLSWNVWPNSRLEATKSVVPFGALYTPIKRLPNMPVSRLCHLFSCRSHPYAVANITSYAVPSVADGAARIYSYPPGAAPAWVRRVMITE